MVAVAAIDWRHGDHYAGLARGERHAFAWEWLRRSPCYRAAWQARAGLGDAGDDVARFGLHRWEPPDLAVPAARPIWRALADPYVLSAHADLLAGHNCDLFDIRGLGEIAHLHLGANGQEHWLFTDGWRAIRLDILRGSLLAGPALLHYRLSGLEAARPQVAALGRLIALSRTRRISSTLFPRERRARRWLLILRTHDALAAGATQRDIAETLLGMTSGPRWRVTEPGYRRRAQRLVEAARRMARADPILWLRGEVG